MNCRRTACRAFIFGNGVTYQAWENEHIDEHSQIHHIVDGGEFCSPACVALYLLIEVGTPLTERRKRAIDDHLRTSPTEPEPPREYDEEPF